MSGVSYSYLYLPCSFMEATVMNYGFYISGGSDRLKKFLLQKGVLYSNIKVIISEYEIEKELKKILDEKNIKVVLYEYGNLGTTNKERNLKFSNCLLVELRKYKIDFCFSFGSHILSGELLHEYKYKIVNFHPALLPMYPGRKAIDQAVDDNRALLVGNTAHFIDEGVDTGPIIMQSVIPLQSFLNSNNYEVVLDLQIHMLNQLIEIFEKKCLEIIDNKVSIIGADYNSSFTFPVWNG